MITNNFTKKDLLYRACKFKRGEIINAYDFIQTVLKDYEEISDEMIYIDKIYKDLIDNLECVIGTMDNL